MNPRELILLSPFRFPGQNPLMIGVEDMACFLNGYLALWHPALLPDAAALPRIGSPYDFEQPAAGQVFAVPENPPLFLPDDWDQRVRAAGAVVFRSHPDRGITLENLKTALTEASGHFQPAEVEAGFGDSAVAKPFFGVGLGYLAIDTLYEAMEHEKLLVEADLLQELREASHALLQAAPDAGDVARGHLQKAAARLQSAREVLYPVSIHLIDLCLLGARGPETALPGSLEKGLALNLIASGAALEKLSRERPEVLASLRDKIGREEAEVCGGAYREREDAFLPVESQLTNLLHGLSASRELLGQDVRIFARQRFSAHPQLPLLLNTVGLHRAVHLAFDEAVLPTYRVPIVNWPSPDGKQVEAFARTPYPADAAQTFFHLAHYLHKTIAQDQSATLVFLHAAAPDSPWYDDLLELSRLAPVLGQWTTLSRYMNEVLAGEYASAASADAFHSDYLSERTGDTGGNESSYNAQPRVAVEILQPTAPVSWFARHARLRRRLDSAWTVLSLERSLSGPPRPELTALPRPEERLAEIEKQVETGGNEQPADLEKVEQEAAERLASRLVARAATETPGFLVLNPCSFTRRLALEIEGITGFLPWAGPVKAFQRAGDKAQMVVEVPPLGFAWFPAAGEAESAPPPSKLKLADDSSVRNEYFEAEIDRVTGGLRTIRDHRSRLPRLGQHLVYNPGSHMRASSITVVSTGPALGEIATEGTLTNDEGETLATFKQRFRAWRGRPVLEMRLEITPTHPPQGYPWHAYYGARFTWRPDRTTLVRGVNGTAYVTTHTRPQTPDFLEIRQGKHSTVVFPGGLPFHQRHGEHMLDMILIPERETCQVFDLALGLDRDYPMQTAVGLITPSIVVPTTKGPPQIGSAGWLFHLDSPNIVLTSLRPSELDGDAVTARFLECASHAGRAEFRCVRDPRKATLVDALGNTNYDATVYGDTVAFETGASDLVQVRVDFS